MKPFCLSLFLFFVIHIESQNLVPNPGFEDTVSCPVSYGNVVDSKHWDQCGPSTADFFHTCVSSTKSLGVPRNVLGYQQPLTGKAYAGLYTYESGWTNYREFVGTQLAVPLITGQTYFIRFFVSRAENTGYSTGDVVSTNKIGARFMTKPCINMAYFIPDNFAHIFSNKIITDTTNWTAVSGNFTADSAYRYIYIGNFFDADSTKLFPNTNLPSYYISYYYVDEVCVSLNPNYCNNLTNLSEIYPGNSIEIYPNPTHGTIRITSANSETISFISVKNIHGKEIEYFDSINAPEFFLNLSSSAEGLYFLAVDFGDKIVHTRIIKN